MPEADRPAGLTEAGGRPQADHSSAQDEVRNPTAVRNLKSAVVPTQQVNSMMTLQRSQPLALLDSMRA